MPKTACCKPDSGHEVGEAMNLNSRSYFQYLPIGPKERQWDIYVTGTGRETLVGINDSDYAKGHPAPYYYHWENGRVLHEFAVLFFTKGRGEFESETTGKKIITAGNVVLVFPGLWHRYRPVGDAGWTAHWATFGGGYMKHLVQEGFFSPDNPVLNTGLDDAILRPCLTMLDRVQIQSPGYQQLIAANTIEILAAALAAIQSNRIQGKFVPLVDQARMLMEQRLEEPVDLRELAAILHVSYDRFRHVFKQNTGLAPYQYHLLLRINRAKELLLQTGFSIKDIAKTLQFDSPYHFSEIFKKKTGVSPIQWRGRPKGLK